ncbi:hypothetical protein QL285_069515 [Trifolium repens]|nr:hypothetical protein QL285_069515 [Trifolium repens]
MDLSSVRCISFISIGMGCSVLGSIFQWFGLDTYQNLAKPTAQIVLAHLKLSTGISFEIVWENLRKQLMTIFIKKFCLFLEVL